MLTLVYRGTIESQTMLSSLASCQLGFLPRFVSNVILAKSVITMNTCEMVILVSRNNSKGSVTLTGTAQVAV